MAIKKKSRSKRALRSQKGAQNAAKRSAIAKTKTGKLAVTGHAARAKAVPVGSARAMVEDLGVKKDVIEAARRALAI